MNRTWAALVGWCLFASTSNADDLKAPPSEIAKLIEQLGARDYAVREAAGKRLVEIGDLALAPLAAVPPDHPERSTRAARLLVSIRDRLENEKLLAPTLVVLPRGEQPLRRVFELIETQSRIKLDINGDSSVLNQRVKLSGGEKPFWEHLQQVVSATGLDVAEVNEYRVGSVRQTEEDKSDEVVRMTPMRQGDAQKLKDHIQELNDQIAKSTDPAEKADLKNDVARVTRYYEKLTGVDQRMEERKKARESLLGRVTLKLAPKTNPACATGAVRIESIPVPANLLKRYPTDQFPLMMKVQGEPKLAWQCVTELLIVEAIDERGRSLAPTFFTPDTYTNLANDELQLRRANMGLSADEPYRLVPHDMGIATLAAVSAQPLKLKSIRGLVKATLVNRSGESALDARLRASNPFLLSSIPSHKPVKEVLIPFHLTDVSLVPGTGDGKPLPEDYSERLKR